MVRWMCLLAAVATASASGISRDGLAQPATNVVLIMCDDLGWGDLRCFNPQSPIHTPHLDQLAAAGLKFNRFYAAAPLCSPTRGSCLTGRHPYRYGIYGANRGHMKAAELTLPELLRKAGYATGHFGKWHLGTLTTEVRDSNRGGPRGREHYSTPPQHGYDVCLVTEAKVPTYDPLFKPRGADGTAWDYLQDFSLAVPYGTHYWDEQGRSVTHDVAGDDARIIMDRALPFIEQAVTRRQPFLAVIWFHAPHLPVVAGPRHVEPYAEHDVYHRNYYGCVTALDEQVGRLRAALRQWNVAENTMLWFCSDNGPEGRGGEAPGSAGPFRGRKRSLYEGGVRVPGLLEWPARVVAGSSTDVAAVTSDYLPTVLDALQIRYPEDRPLDGISLLPVIDGTLRQRPMAIGFQSSNQWAWSGTQYKLYSADEGATWELYDVLSDPGEQTDLAQQLPQRAEAMRRELQTWLASCRASDAGADYDR